MCRQSGCHRASHRIWLFTVLPFALLLALCPRAAAATMTINSLTGPVTQTEISSFTSYVQNTSTPGTSNSGNDYVYGGTGRGIEGMGMMYEVSGSRPILDRMIQFSDTVLSNRSSIVSWNGQQQNIWPNTPTGLGGTEQGDILGHLAYTAELILKTPSLWNVSVTGGDPDGFGTTYLQRAQTYIAQADQTANNYLKLYVSPSKSNRYYFPNFANDGGTANTAVPWNQQMMINNGFERLAEVHQILGDNPAEVAQFDGYVKTSVDWFLSSTTLDTVDGKQAATWGYSSGRTNEDIGHGAYDMGGLFRAFFSGRYGITAAEMQPYANTIDDVVTLGPKLFASRVNAGASDGTQNWMLGEYIFLADFDPNIYTNIATADMAAGGRQNQNPNVTASILWVKNERNLGLFPVPEPATDLLMLFGTGCIAAAWRFKRGRKSTEAGGSATGAI